MPPRTRSGRRNNTKRTILGAVSENELSRKANYTEIANTAKPSKIEPHTIPDDVDSGKSFEIPIDFDGTSSESVNILLQDIERKVKKLQESIFTKNSMVVEEMKSIRFITSMNVPRNTKKMTVRNFNSQYLEESEDIIDLIGTVTDEANKNNAAIVKKRIRTGKSNTVKSTVAMELETPLRNIRPGAEFRTPGTLARTVKRGEILYSINGSPVDQTGNVDHTAEEGDIVATVSKKRRGNDAAVFDINVGDGRYISLSDPSSVQHLDPQMKSTAKTQLKVMQDQMTMLMAKLGN